MSRWQLKRLRFLGSKSKHLNRRHERKAIWIPIANETQNEYQT